MALFVVSKKLKMDLFVVIHMGQRSFLEFQTIIYQNVSISDHSKNKSVLSNKTDHKSKVVFCQSLSSVKGHLQLKVVFRQRPSSLKIIFRQMLSSVKDRLPSKVVFHQIPSSSNNILHQRSSSIKGRLPSEVFRPRSSVKCLPP